MHSVYLASSQHRCGVCLPGLALHLEVGFILGPPPFLVFPMLSWLSLAIPNHQRGSHNKRRKNSLEINYSYEEKTQVLEFHLA